MRRDKVINGKSVIYFFFSFSLDTCAKLRRTTVSCFMSVCLSVRPSVRPHWTTGIAPKGFSRNLIFWCFSKICWENSSFMKVWKGYFIWRPLYIHDNILPNSSLHEKFSGQELWGKSKHILYSTPFFSKIMLFWNNLEKYWVLNIYKNIKIFRF